MCLFLGGILTERVKMKEINGIFASAKIFNDDVEEYAAAQIAMICDNAVSKNSVIRVMPDVHPGKVGTIGLTMTVGNQILPNLVGSDIGCGITIAPIKKGKLEFQKLDKVIREQIPSGFEIRKKPHQDSSMFEFGRLRCFERINYRKAECSLGTLGGGNHFIELDKGDDGTIYAVVHSGSRHLGKEVTEYYLQEGQKILKEEGENVPYELTYLTGRLMEDYLHDQQVLQDFAELNRGIILTELAKGMKWKMGQCVSCIHNYIEVSEEPMILRKGAISARKGEDVVIPINMRDGVILGIGKGNADWNQSAPHGSGRIMNRTEVKNQYTVSQFKSEMKGIYSSCIGRQTLDEAPFAYRDLKVIEAAVRETVQIRQVIQPVYNFKAGN